MTRFAAYIVVQIKRDNMVESCSQEVLGIEEFLQRIICKRVFVTYIVATS